MKKTLFVLLAMVLVLAMIPVTGLAASTINVSNSAELATALATAGIGDTISLSNGSYTLAQTTIDKELTITGESEAGVIIVPSVDLAVPSYKNPGSGLIEVGAAGSLTISNLTIDGAGKKVALALKTNGELIVSNVTIKNIEYQLYNGIGIGVYQDAALPNNADLSVTNVTMSNIERIGIHAKGNTTVNGFTYTGKGDIDCLDYAMEIGSLTHTTFFAVSVINSTISDCLGVASSDGSGSAGLYANTYYYSLNNGAVPLAPPIDITFDNIIFSNCSVGVYVGYKDGYPDYSDVLVQNSSFSGCKYDFAFYSKQPSGSLTVSANTYDGGVNPTASLGENNIIVGLDGKPVTLAENTEVTAGVDPTYMIIIPAAVDFGTLIKGTGVKEMPFPVQATGVVIESGSTIDVSVSSGFLMDDGGTTPITLAYSLFNVETGGTALVSGDQFAVFTSFGGSTQTQNGRVSVNADDITAAGSYKGTMDFTISYN